MAGTSFRFGIQKLNGKNYPIWSEKAELILIKEKVWEVVRDELLTPADAVWTEEDSQARATIGLLIEYNQFMPIYEVS